MLVLDPSSECDVCFESFAEGRECFSIPCGHVFCLRCLRHLQQKICPLCRNPFAMRRIRKMHVDMSKSLNHHAEDNRLGDRGRYSNSILEFKMLEEILSSEELLSQGLALQRARDMYKKLKSFLRDKSKDQHPLMMSIKALLKQYISRVEENYEGASNAKATQASYEDHIRHLERQLEEQKQKVKAQALRRSKNESNNNREIPQISTHRNVPASGRHPQHVTVADLIDWFYSAPAAVAAHR